MSIRHSLLAILDQGDCYGYQLRVEFDRRAGGGRSLNVGQVYATLERLERDGLISTVGANSTGHVYYAITSAGSAEVDDWFGGASVDEDLGGLAMKFALAQSLPGVDARAMLARHRDAADAAVETARAEVSSDGSVSRRLVAEARAQAAVARRGWLDTAAQMLEDTRPFPLESEPPRRGRPVRA